MTENKLKNTEECDHCSHNTPKLRSVTMGKTSSVAKTNAREIYDREPHSAINRQSCNQSVKDAAFRSGWNDPILTRIGDFYPISPTHRTFPKSNVPMILERLVSVFRLSSFHTTFYESPCVRAVCRSMRQVELCVNLWESSHQPHVAILEIQRISGDTILYAKHARRIFAYAFQKASCSKSSDISTLSTIADQDNHTGLGEQTIVPRSVIDDALNIASSMVLADRRDTRSLGLESLVILTDTTKTEISVAREVANVILLGQSEDSSRNVQAYQQLQRRLSQLAFCGQWSDSIRVSGESSYDDRPHVHLALMAIANALSLASPEVVDAAWDMHDASFLMSALEKYIWNARHDPHAAYLATRIYLLIYRVRPSTIRCSITLEEAVRAAQHIGHCSHAALATETGELLSAWGF